MNVLIYGETETSAALRHEVPLPIGDPFLYLESDGRRAVMTNALEDARIARALPDLERLLVDALGRDELIERGLSSGEIEQDLCARAVSALGIGEAIVPPTFPVALADHLRGAGVLLTPEGAVFAERRRRKSSEEMAGIRRAADAAVSAMQAAAGMLRGAETRDGALWWEGELLTSEAVRGRIRDVCGRAGAPAPGDIMGKAMGLNPPIGHDPGFGPLPANTPILIDLWPRDEQSGCWADMTRSFVRGDISPQLAALHTLVLEAHQPSCEAVKPGVGSDELYDIACRTFENAGHRTGRTKKPGETLREGFYHGLGHSVGLEVHEAPSLGRSGAAPLVVGDVIAIEPGTVVPPLGGIRVEDLLIGSDGGSENLTGGFPTTWRSERR